ncbi:MAG: hypothetical protein ACP5IA_02915, partial [Sediminispirochaetaceae bacterium]
MAGFEIRGRTPDRRDSAVINENVGGPQSSRGGAVQNAAAADTDIHSGTRRLQLLQGFGQLLLESGGDLFQVHPV